MGLFSFLKSLLFGSGSKKEDADDHVIIENTDSFRTIYNEYDETEHIQVAKRSNKTRPSLHVLQNQDKDSAKHTGVEKSDYSFTNKNIKERTPSKNSDYNSKITNLAKSNDFQQDYSATKRSFSEIETTSDLRGHQLSHKGQDDSTSIVFANQNNNKLVQHIQKSSGTVRQEHFSEKKYYDTSTGKLETFAIVPESDNATIEISNVKVEDISSVSKQEGNKVGTSKEHRSFESECRRNSDDQVENKFEEQYKIQFDNTSQSKTTQSKHHEKTDSFGKIIQELDDNLKLYETTYDKSAKEDKRSTGSKQHEKTERNTKELDDNPYIHELSNNKSASEYGFIAASDNAKSLTSFEIIENIAKEKIVLEVEVDRYEHGSREVREESQKTETGDCSLASFENLEYTLNGLAEISNSIPSEISSKPQEDSEKAETGNGSLTSFGNFDNILKELDEISNDKPTEVSKNPQEQNVVIPTTNRVQDHSFIIAGVEGNREKEPSSMINVESFSEEFDDILDKLETVTVQDHISNEFPKQTPETKDDLKTSFLREEYHKSDVEIEYIKAFSGPLNALASEFKPKNDKNVIFNIKEDELAASQVAADQFATEQIAEDHIKVDSTAADQSAANQFEADQTTSHHVGADQIQPDQTAADRIAANQISADQIEAYPIETDQYEANQVQAGECQDTDGPFKVPNEIELSDHAKACRRTLHDINTRVQNVGSRIETIFVDDDDYYNYTEQLLALSIEVDAVKSNREQVIRGWKKMVLKKIHQFEDRAEVKLKEFNNS